MIYDHRYGTSFGFNISDSDDGMIVRGITTNGHSYRDFGLFPVEKPVIEAAEVDTRYVDVPGMDGSIDLTESLDGVTHYKNRTGTFRFVSIGRENWSAAFQKLKNWLHGKQTAIVTDEEPDGYYWGRTKVEPPEYDYQAGKAVYEVSANLDPYKYEFTSTDEDWLWDPFSFETGVIREYGEIAITNSLDFEIVGSGMPVTPDIKLLSGSVSVTFAGHTGDPIVLTTGSNLDKLYELNLRENAVVTLHFTGTGTVSICYDLGWL